VERGKKRKKNRIYPEGRKTGYIEKGSRKIPTSEKWSGVKRGRKIVYTPREDKTAGIP